MLAVETILPTVDGWATVANVQPGERVFDGNGNRCRVTSVSEVREVLDGCEVRSREERVATDTGHQWPVTPRPGQSFSPVTSEALIATPPVTGRAKVKYLPVTPELRLRPSTRLAMAPYVLGVWLVKGATGKVSYSSPYPEIAERIRREGYDCRQGRSTYWILTDPDDTHRCGSPSRVRRELDKLRVWAGDRIPPEYLRAGHDQRLALLQGVVDATATLHPSGFVDVDLRSQDLARDLQALLYSLGVMSVVRQWSTPTSPRPGKPWRVNFMKADAASIPQKTPRCRDSTRASNRPISAVGAGASDVRRVTVDSHDGIFLVGRSLLPTCSD